MPGAMRILVRNIRQPLSVPESEILEQAVRRLAPFVVMRDVLSRAVFRRSVDTRHKTVTFVWSVLIETAVPLDEKTLSSLDCAVYTETDPTEDLLPGAVPSGGRPVVVGFGPCGMFAALLLAERGYRPLVLERGDNVLTRAQKVAIFLKTGKLDPDSSVPFGAGGAGTFSDGKLVTRVNDPFVPYVLKRLVEFGAPAEILTRAKPHIGTDRLLGVVSAIDRRIRERGGEVRYRCRATGLVTSAGRVTAVRTTDGEIPCGSLLLAVGHSARDTYADLARDGAHLTPKPFSVGVRIEHLQSEIDRAVYGDYAGHPLLGPAEYALSRRVGEEAVYTFCMCPGGEVIAAASEEGGVVTNGMSRYRRDGKNANAALVVSVSPDDPIAFQRSLEREAFRLGGGAFAAPIQTVGDFLAGKRGTEPSRVLPTYRRGAVRLADLAALFPERIMKMLRLGLADFDRKLPGFASPAAILTGVETRTSSPVRIPRGEDRLATGFTNLYPCGEGAGYAGGISSAAVDGLRTAMAVIRRFAPFPDGDPL